MIELRWLLSRTQVEGAFNEPLDWPDGTTVFARLQYRDRGMVQDDRKWLEIPTVSEVPPAPRVQLVGGRGPKGH